MKKSYEGFYIYNNYDFINKVYNPIYNLIPPIYVNDVELRLRTNRVVLIELNTSMTSYSILFKDIFYNPSYNFIIERELNDFILSLNKQYFNNQYYDFLCYTILNAHKHYLENLKEDSSSGIENDFKTLESEKRKLIELLKLFINKYKLSEPNSKPLLKAKFCFLDKNIELSNPFILNDLLSAYLEKYDFSISNPNIWEKEIDRHLIGFNVEDLEKQLRMNLAKNLNTFIIENNIIKKGEEKISNASLRIINIIFSLASIKINKSTLFYDKRLEFKKLQSLDQIELLRKWITRPSTYSSSPMY